MDINIKGTSIKIQPNDVVQVPNDAKDTVEPNDAKGTEQNQVHEIIENDEIKYIDLTNDGKKAYRKRCRGEG